MTMTTKMTRSRRPRSREDRDVCIAATDDFASRVGLQPVVAAILAASYAPTRDTYALALANNDAAAATYAQARVAKVKAGRALDTAFRRWVATVVDDEGKPLTGPLRTTLGVTPGGFLRKKSRTKLKILRRKFRVLEASARLRGDRARFAELQAATTAFAPPLAALEASIRARRDAVAKFEVATADFDKVYGTLAAAVLDYEPTGKAMIPVFYRPVGPTGAESANAVASAVASAAAQAADDDLADLDEDDVDLDDQGVDDLDEGEDGEEMDTEDGGLDDTLDVNDVEHPSDEAAAPAAGSRPDAAPQAVAEGPEPAPITA